MKILFIILISLILISCTESSGYIKTSDTGFIKENKKVDSLPLPPSYLTDTLLNQRFGNSSTSLPRDGYWLYKDSVVRSIGSGQVLYADSGRIEIKYPRLVNGKRKDLIVNYSINNKPINLHPGLIVTPNQIIVISTNGYSISCNDKNTLPTLFKAKFTVPLKESSILIVNKSEYNMWWLRNGKVMETFPIALGQEPRGHKTTQGDNKTPEGEYFIVEKLKGPFHSPTADYLGNSWFRLNYPNSFDALEGFRNGLITESQKNSIIKAYNLRKDTPNNTRLGGDIGIHGWINDWINYSTRDITWGCVSMRNDDIDRLYENIDIPVKVIILP